MLPYVPSLALRPLDGDALAAAAELINRQVLRAPYSAPLGEDELREQLLGEHPAGLLTVRWQRRQPLCVWRAGELVGMADIGTGIDSDSLTLPDYHALGLLRLLVLPDRADLLEPAAVALFDAAEAFWRANKVGHVKAYHVSTGYPTFQAGAGMLPGDWAEQVRLLTARGFRFAERFYCLARTLDQLFEEAVPQGGLNLAFRGTRADRRYQVFFRRTELIAEARLLQRPQVSEGFTGTFGYIAHWEVDERWRNQDLGRWLLRRMINDATQQGVSELVIHVQAQHYAAMNLLAQHGFVEQNYRGYSFELNLTA